MPSAAVADGRARSPVATAHGVCLLLWAACRATASNPNGLPGRIVRFLTTNGSDSTAPIPLVGMEREMVS